jgi:hypothetical protein
MNYGLDQVLDVVVTYADDASSTSWGLKKYLSENVFIWILRGFKVKKRFRFLAIKAIFVEEVLSYAVAVRQLRLQHLESMQEGTADVRTRLLSWGGRDPFTATLKPIPSTPVLPGPDSDHANSPPGSLPGSPPGSGISGGSGTSLGNYRKAQGVESHKSPGRSLRTQQGPELSAWSASADHEQNNVVHKQHLDDLFKKNLRTEHYSRKLSMLYPPDPEQRAKLLVAVSVIQKCMRNWRARTKIRAEFAEKNRKWKPPSSDM